ncbi:Rho GTPase activation protein (RhoGAP) with PHdomain [Striga asiatica]|uniref:Rho GTPase activation protein (RhoGAP) with PHdomain n=1 Tax=Striga asiatica TaxID=4170 RepID=A0A5A7RA45_STRAF|nr:Rho GTPase activation protein (RhoGAP) with PHdomain [Striga asiatica]
MSIKFYAPRTNLPNFAAYIGRHTTYPPGSSLRKNNLCRRVGLALFSSFSTGLYYSSSTAVTHKHIHPWREVPRFCEGTVNSGPVEEPPDIDGEQSRIDGKKRRKKRRHGNKGRAPWNKGRKHSEETREKIRRRTKEAMEDPKIRKKMSESARIVMSDQTKAKIKAAYMMRWRKQLKWKRSSERFMLSWAQSIAKAAKVGMSDEKELYWDSYNKLKEEIALQIHHTAQEADGKAIARVRAQRAAQEKSEKMARLPQERREHEENVKAREGSFKKRNLKSEEEIERLAEFREERLKEKIMKIHKKLQVNSQHHEAIEGESSSNELESLKKELEDSLVCISKLKDVVKNQKAELTHLKEEKRASEAAQEAREVANRAKLDKVVRKVALADAMKDVGLDSEPSS